MVTPRVTRALNPQRKRKLSAKQIRAGFGGKRRRASLKASRPKHRKRTAPAVSNPKPRKARKRAKAKNLTRTKVVYRTKYKTRTKKVYVNPKPKRKAKAKAKRRRSSNPGYLLTMSPVAGNPHKKRRKSNMAKAKRRVSAKGRSGKRRNPTRRRSVARRGHRPRSRNPFGESSNQILKTGFGVFLGFSAGKKVPPMLGPTANSSPMMSLITTAAVAGLAAWLANRFAKPIATGVLWGGAGAVFNVAWNAWAPASIAGYAGVGDFVAGGFPLPQGPVRYPGQLGPGVASNGAQVDVGAFGQAFTRAW